MSKTITRDGIHYILSSEIPKFDVEMVKKNNIDFFFEDGKIYVDGWAYLAGFMAYNREIEANNKKMESAYKQIKAELKTKHPFRYIAFIISLPFANLYWFLTRKLGM